MGLDMTDDNRLTRLVGRATLRRISSDRRCWDCGVVAHGSLVGMRLSEGRAAAAGLVTCARIWLCPTCNAKVMAARALEIGIALAYAEAHGLTVIWGALTVRHNMHDRLADLLEVQASGWRYVVNSHIWRDADIWAAKQRLRHQHYPDRCMVDDPCDGNAVCTRKWRKHQHNEQCKKGCRARTDVVLSPNVGRFGYIRASEINIGANGWHPHFHPIIVWKGSRASAETFAGDVVNEWVLGVEAAGGEAIREGGQQLAVLNGAEAYKKLDEYVTKQTYALSLEAVWSQSKTGKSKKGRAGKSRQWGTLPHWSLLASIAVGGGDAADIERWWELEKATKGHRMISWSRRLRALAGVAEDERTDEEIADEEHGSVDDTVCFITAEGWAELAKHPEVVAELMTTLESSGWKGLRALLTVWRVEYLLPADVLGTTV